MIKCRTIILTAALIILISCKGFCGSADVGFFWKSNTLPYDTEFSYFFDVAVYPDGIFLDDLPHYYVYVTAENMHIVYNGVPYSVETVAAYFTSNANDGLIVMDQYDDPKRFINPWIDADSDVPRGWRISTLNEEGYLTTETNGVGEALDFLRVQEQSLFISESTNPVQSIWENRYYFYNFQSQQWDKKMGNRFVIPASRADVRASTYQSGGGEWAAILETSGNTNDIDHGSPPIKDVCYMNRSVKVVNEGTTLVSPIDSSINSWMPPSQPYQLDYVSQTNDDQFVASWNGADPFITANPGNTLVAPDSNTTLSVSAIGTTPLSYQWFANGIPINGATDSNYTTPDLSSTDSGITYSAVVSNSFSAMTSTVATLTVAERQVLGWGSTNGGNLNFPPVLSNAEAISAGPNGSLALLWNGTVIAWGGNHFGLTNVPAGLTNVIQISDGYYHCLALKNDGTITAWGTDYYGNCHVPTTATNIISVAAGGRHSLAIKSDGRVIGWGDIKKSDGSPALIPKNLDKVVAIAAGQSHSLALRKNGTVVAWGDNTYGECDVPKGLSHVIAISAGNNFSLALRQDGTLVAWGDNSYGECDAPPDLSHVAAISAGSAWSAMAMTQDGNVVTWGLSGTGRLVPPINLGPVTQIATGGYFALAIQNATPLLRGGPPPPPFKKKPQTIIFPAIHPLPYGSSFTPPAWVTSGLKVDLSVLSGPAYFSNNILMFLGIGTVTVTANQLGNSSYDMAKQIINTFIVTKASQVITPFILIPPKTIQSAPFSITLPTANSGLPVTVIVKSGPATISGNTVTLTGLPGKVVLAADQSGDPNHKPAPEVTTLFLVKTH